MRGEPQPMQTILRLNSQEFVSSGFQRARNVEGGEREMGVESKEGNADSPKIMSSTGGGGTSVEKNHALAL